ncbi:PP2C family serine/threonine-protein phosphatase [Budvicia diplopodorum]|uniref:PP2C family serine/threonine-protein phosphatase n=1 Tax=Budvicia diplopodorum TaxID=1119056 RepID=UPI00135B0E60|nr:PP2C family serine/threonine-protein phosphatase [Budvicia diplopodorum]
MTEKRPNARSLLSTALSHRIPALSELELSQLENNQDIQQIIQQFSLSLNEKVERLNAAAAVPVEQAMSELPDAETQVIDDLSVGSDAGLAAIPLKPGQIPAQSSAPAVAPKGASMPNVNFNFANARVNTAYRSKIEPVSHTGEAVLIHAIAFSHDIGITFDPQTQELFGTPTADGDYRLFITWTTDGKTSYTTDALIIVNPDPRSLWKIIEPPADDKYFKANTDSRVINENGVTIAAASRRGRSHEHVGSFRDDDFFIAHDADNGWTITIVADGAGSAPNSRKGSEIASKTAGDYLSTQMKGEQGLKLKALVQDWQPESQKLVGPLFSELYRNAAKLAVNAIENEAILMGQATKSYATTLLATVSIRCGDELFAAAFWMGDGAIAAYGPVGKVRLLGTPDSGEYAGQTRFLDNDAINDSGFNSRIMIGKWADISHLILMTDGVSDPYFETDNGLLSAERWDKLVNEILPCLQPDEAAEKLTDWLSFFSPGNHDDRTIAISW